jgi:hypothetical protein
MPTTIRQVLLLSSLLLLFSGKGGAKTPLVQYSITDFGAVGDSITLNTAAIQAAIDTAHARGGGEIIIPPGIFYSGSIVLKSNTHLFLAPGSKLLASTELKDYPMLEVDYTSINRSYGGHEVMAGKTRFAFIIAHQAKNISITGLGVIDGNGGNGTDFKVTVDKHGKWHKPKRPAMIHFISCEDILLRDVDIQYCQNWHVHMENCEKIDIDNITITGHANANDDGIDINSCRDVTIQNCSVDVGDDGLVFKTKGKATNENILVTNCVLASETRCIQFGSETEGDMRNIVIRNVLLKPTAIRPEWPEPGAKPISKLIKRSLGTGISINSNDGGTLENITISQVRCIDLPSPLYLHTARRHWKYSEGRYDTTLEAGSLRNIHISDFIATGIKNTANPTIMGLPERPLENIHLSDLHFEFTGTFDPTSLLTELTDLTEHCAWPGYWGKEKHYPAYGLECRYIEGLSLNNLTFSIKEDPRPALILSHTSTLQIGSVTNLGGTGKTIVTK